MLGVSSVLVGPATLVSGGAAPGSAPGLFDYDLGYYAPAPANSTVLLDPRAVLREVPAFSPFPIPSDLNATYHSWVIADEPYIVSIAGPSNGFALLVLGDWTAPTPTPFGSLALDPLTAQFVDVIALPPPAGAHDWSFHCPAAAANAHGFAFQALTLSPQGGLGLTIPSPLTVGWQHGRIP